MCVDLVGYSTRSVAQQIAVKEAFNRILGQVLEAIPEQDRIILDTGDGAAISFLGDPEQSLEVGVALQQATLANAGALGAAPGAQAVRMGLNLGPVKVAADMNGYPKIIGDGHNVAERIMAFAKPGQVAVSRSFYDMVSRLSDENAKLFRFEGARTDKNAREHQVYVIEPGASGGKRRRAGSGSASQGAASGALIDFLEDKLKVGAASALLLALILGESALLARKWRQAVPTVAAIPAETAPASRSADPAGAKPAKPAPPAASPAPAAAPKPEATAVAKPEPGAEAKPDPPPAEAKRPEPKLEAKVEPRPEPAKPRPEPKAADPVSPVEPNLVSIAPLNFPAEAAARGINAGSVKARLTIDASGKVTRVQILSATPARGFFDEEATRSLRDWKFDRGPANRQYTADIQFKK